ncbi:MAG: GNAT family N-acetyltransferase [Alphaproteobacteria bacterium]
MPDGREPTTIKVLSALGDIPAADWDACAGADNPFVAHGFLSALEDSGSASTDSGWMPQHLVALDDAGKAVAAAPLYLKSHSYGEYVFDWGWADAYERAGGRYYPKLISAVPFTPATGRRFLLHPDAPEDMTDVLIAGIVQLADKLNVSSAHINFPSEAEWRRCGANGLLMRQGRQFHWENRGYDTFDDFLATLSSRKRKAIRKERRGVEEQAVTVSTLTGGDITEAHWDAFYGFYRDTTGRKWGHRYLTRNFFSLLHERLPERIVLVMAEANGRFVGGALNLRGHDTLYGRYWGCIENYRFLHFEACYYRAIDYAIEHKLAWVEAGAQGPHKIQRGYLPRATYSAHWIKDPNFRAAVQRFLEAERAEIDGEIALLMEQSPYRQD